MHIRTRNELIKYIEDNAPSQMILRAVLNINVNLGGFRKLSAGIGGGWIVKVTSQSGRQWLLGVAPDKIFGYRLWQLVSVPWRYYEGHTSDNLLYRGDNPEEYKELRDKEVKDAKT